MPSRESSCVQTMFGLKSRLQNILEEQRGLLGCSPGEVLDPCDCAKLLQDIAWMLALCFLTACRIGQEDLLGIQ